MAFPKPNIVDLAAVILILAGILIGRRRGLSRELGNLLNVLGSAVLAIAFYGAAADGLAGLVSMDRRLLLALCFTAIGAGTFVTILVLRLVLGKIGQITFNETLNLAGGGLAGFIEWTVGVVMLFLILNVWSNPWLHRHFRAESLIGRSIVKVLPQIHSAFGRLPLGLPQDKPAKPPPEASDSAVAAPSEGDG